MEPPIEAEEPPAPPPPPLAPPPDEPIYSPRKKTRPKRRRSVIGRLFFIAFFLVFVFPALWVAVYRFAPPPATPLMLIRAAEGKGMDYRWRPINKVSPALVQSLIAAEDARFCEHDGFDMEAIQKAMRNNERRPNRQRGGSTISQQTAKNAFLWPERSLLRKGVEAYFTVLIESVWGKRRIMEVYLNIVEWGPGTYGAEAAARRWFHKSAANLTRPEAARLAAILPSPLKWKAAKPGPYVKRRSRRIGAASGTVRHEGLAGCV
ncbi:MAG: monofunctional biosynthetic peptidoglycan transglycosylase [Caulobacteraceae bacterium]